MRAELILVYKSVHTWTGILSGMALFIAFYAGAITLFKEPLVHWASPPVEVGPEGGALPLADAQPLIVEALRNQPDAAGELLVHVAPLPVQPERVEWYHRPEGVDEHDTLSAQNFVATLDADGTVGARQVQRSPLAAFIDVLHRVVGLPFDTPPTRMFMGVVAGLYFLALFSGFVILLPSLVKDLFALRVGKNLKRMWLDAHNVIGLGSFPFHIVMALTAATFAFHDPIYILQDAAIHGGKLGAMFGGGPADGAPRDPADMRPPTDIVASVLAVAPDFQPTWLRYTRATGPKASVMVFGRGQGDLEFRAVGGMALVDPYSGKVMTTQYLPGHQGAAATTLTSFFALHFASYGGGSVKWLYFVLGMLGAWLFYSGNLLWIETRRRKAKPHVDHGAVPEQRRDTRFMASATVGVCLGATIGISLTIASAKWLHGRVDDLTAAHRAVYYLAFFASLAWAFLRGGARAAVDLLRLAAAAALAIPATSLLGALAPSLGPWSHAELAPLCVDAVAAVVAVGFALMARAAARRVQEGPVDSVWSSRDASGTAHAHAEAVGDTSR